MGTQNEKIVLDVSVEDGASRPLEQVEQNLTRVDQAAKNTAQATKKVDQNIKGLGDEAKETDKKLEETETTLEKVQNALNDVDDAASRLGGSGGSLGSISDGLELIKNPAIAAAGAVVGLVSAYGAINVEAQQTNAVLLGLAGSQKRANEVLEYARKVANDLGTEVSATAKTWVSFDNAMTASGYSAEQSRSLFETLSHAIIKTGRNY